MSAPWNSARNMFVNSNLRSLQEVLRFATYNLSIRTEQSSKSVELKLLVVMRRLSLVGDICGILFCILHKSSLGVFIFIFFCIWLLLK